MDPTDSEFPPESQAKRSKRLKVGASQRRKLSPGLRFRVLTTCQTTFKERLESKQTASDGQEYTLVETV